MNFRRMTVVVGVWASLVGAAGFGPARQAQASVGLVTPVVGLPVAVAGGLLMSVSSVTFSTRWGWRRHVVIFSPTLFLTGLVLLDAQTDSAMLSFSPVTDELAQKAGLSVTEVEAFNADVEELNAVAEEVAFELTRVGRADVEVASRSWSGGLSHFSAETRSAVAKIAVTQIQTRD